MKTTVLVVALKFMLFIECTKSSPESYIKQWNSKPHCNAGDNNYSNDRVRSDGRNAVAIIDYDSNNHHPTLRDNNHAECCDVDDLLITSSSKPNKRNENVKSMQKSTAPNSSNFICAEYGFFPDYLNPKMFYHCAPSPEDDGIIVNHKKCPNDLTFNGLNKKCDVDQLKSNRNVQTKYSLKNKLEFSEYFPCSRTGLFPDKFNASMFWYCERNRKNGFTVTKMLCPDGEIFDIRKRSCVLTDVTISGTDRRK